MTDYRGLMRRKLLEDIYGKMSEEEKRTFIRLTLDNKDHTEIMQALSEINKKTDMNRHSFTKDLLANVAGNGLWDSLLWIGTKLFKKL